MRCLNHQDQVAEPGEQFCFFCRRNRTFSQNFPPRDLLLKRPSRDLPPFKRRKLSEEPEEEPLLSPISPTGYGYTPFWKPTKKEELSVMLWNLQDLGGGPSRGPERDQDIIERIALIINEMNPDILVILEVKGRYDPGPKPKAPAPFQMKLRNSKGTSPKDSERKREEVAQKAYEKQLEKWESNHEKNKELEKSDKQTPGQREFMRIVEALEVQKPNCWRSFLPDSYTGGETYGLLFKGESSSTSKTTSISPPQIPPKLTLVDWKYISTDFKGKPLHWPQEGRRQPIRFRFCYRGQRVFDVVALHAPAPNHEKGEEACNAIANLGKIRIDCDTIVMGDLNADTEPKERGYIDEKKVQDIQGPYADEFLTKRASKALETAMTLWQKEQYGRTDTELWTECDWERTSLKSKVPTKGYLTDSSELGSAAYDKIWLNTPYPDDAFLVPIRDSSRIVPLVEYFMPESLLKTLTNPVFREPHKYAWEKITSLEALLERVKQLSDHVPLMVRYEACYQELRRFGPSLKTLSGMSPLTSESRHSGFRRGEASGLELNCLLHSLLQLRDRKEDDTNTYRLRSQVEELRGNLVAMKIVQPRGMIDIGTQEIREVIEQMRLCVNLYQVINGQLRLIARIGSGRDVALFWSNSHFEPLWP